MPGSGSSLNQAAEGDQGGVGKGLRAFVCRSPDCSEWEEATESKCGEQG